MKKAYFLQFLKKAGLENDPAFKTFIDSSDETIDLTPELVSKIADNLINPTEAVNLPSVENHFKGALFGKTDGKVKELLKVKGYSDDEIKTMLDGKSAEEKIAIGFNAVEQKVKGETKTEKSEREKLLETKYNELEAANKKALEEAQGKYSSLENEFNGYRQAVAFGNYLNKFSLIDLDPELRTDAGIRAITREAEKRGAKVIVTATGIELRDAKDPEKLFYPSDAPTRALSIDDLATPALEAAKLLNKTGRAGDPPAGGGGSGRTPGAGGTGGAGSGRTDKQSASSMAFVTEGLKEAGVL